MSEKTFVSKICVSRLHNLGNYEHVRYEITADVAVTDDPALVLQRLEAVVNGLQKRHGFSEYEIEQAQTVLSKSASELTEREVQYLPTYQAKLEKFNAVMRDREEATSYLRELGGIVEFTDAKDSWDEL